MNRKIAMTWWKKAVSTLCLLWGTAQAAECTTDQQVYERWLYIKACMQADTGSGDWIFNCIDEADFVYCELPEYGKPERYRDWIVPRGL